MTTITHPRVICVGDPQQSLYRFRGADCAAFSRIEEMLERNGRNVSHQRLPRNYRCDQLIINRARKWVPELEGNSDALGTVDIISFGKAVERANNDAFDIALPDGENGSSRSLPVSGKSEVSFAFLCRINLPLVHTAYQLIGMGKRVCILGRDQFGAPLKRIIAELCQVKEGERGRIIEDTEHPDYTNRITDRLDAEREVVEEGFLTRLDAYYKAQAAKLQKEKYEKKLEALQQNVEILEVIATRVKDNKVSGIIREINSLFSDSPKPGVIVLSTIHRAKGGEWDVVFVLRPDLLPHPAAKPNDDGTVSDELQQEYNACYVAATRARHRLYYIDNWPFGNMSTKPLNFDRDDILSVTQYPDVDPAEYIQEPVETQHFGTVPAEAKDAEITEPVHPPVEDVSKPVAEKFVDDGKPF